MATDSVDLFLVCDTTASMGTYVASLSSTLRQIFALTKVLFHGRLCVHLVSYKDYCDGSDVVTYCSQRTHTNRSMSAFVSQLQASGGGDHPEAVKTALHQVAAMRTAATAVVLLYTDAPPHHRATASRFQAREAAAIDANPLYQGGADWFTLRDALGDAHVFTFHKEIPSTVTSGVFYALLGPLIVLDDVSTNTITEASMGLLLQLMGQSFASRVKFAITDVYHKQTTHYDRTLSLPSENDLPDLFSLTTATRPFAFEPLPALRQDLDALPDRFRRDETYQGTVYNVLKVLFTPSLVLAVTYNPIVGKLWSLVCSRRLDPRLKALTTRLSQCVPGLDGDSRRQLQAWIADARDATERIRDVVASASATGGYYILDAGVDLANVDTEALRSLARAPRRGALQQVQTLLTQLQWFATVPAEATVLDDGAPMYLPVDVSDADLFACLPHLLSPGLAFSSTGAMVLALLCALSDHHLLAHRARAHLDARRGHWLHLDRIDMYPELVSLDYIKLLHRGRAFLNSDEAHVYGVLHTMYRLRLAATKLVDVSVGFVPAKMTWHPDETAPCHSCGAFVSFSLMVSRTKCALCVTDGVAGAIARHRAAAAPAGHSRRVQCSRCLALYAVVCVDDLTIAPKCHYCRQHTKHDKIPVTECTGCHNRLLDPAGLYAARQTSNATWRCAVCTTTPAAATSVVPSTIECLFKANPSLASLVQWSKPKKASTFVDLVFDRTCNYFALATQHAKLLFGARRHSIESDGDTTTTSTLWSHGKVILQASALCTELAEFLTHGDLTEPCSLCYNDVPLPGLQSACGRCATRVCTPCLQTWYGATQPGHLLSPPHLTCPFCRRDPTLDVLLRFNRQACAVTTGHRRPQWRHDVYYGWCLACYGVKIMANRACVEAPPTEISDFSCTDCIAAHVRSRFKRCPRCTVRIEKDGGCNHMTCDCGQHFCWLCLQACESGTATYAHLYAAHRGAGW
ncbi:hypothetical protein SPRG_03092 [Saprolegnia parasitica CBS 223.65]|uniref:RING-type domain-containing protein n=1 Tax=Saprolegnia parasitica (strain CBS 223.65) TaxID=695850 RepID=A0A067CZD0_SAPPC|nr:hypothetical protein SPRG_03092 [Saprolegnia parasitica CBS 223.65]KDO31876.1 hypothetical protein SPRG_03092 [Saprolegnia parasitica CBS 223.65]|eukprot:XP_012197075.1 hypothetical protein SPRG_03092 [Saprolegnia parasitica CBS 223.65]